MNSEYKDKHEWLAEEAGDVLCMLKLMVDNDLVTWEQLEERAEVKRQKLMKWSSLNDES